MQRVLVVVVVVGELLHREIFWILRLLVHWMWMLELLLVQVSTLALWQTNEKHQQMVRKKRECVGAVCVVCRGCVGAMLCVGAVCVVCVCVGAVCCVCVCVRVGGWVDVWWILNIRKHKVINHCQTHN